jgi:HPt (histidine-containing phosphotransfer) domain-containing protein
MTTPATAAIDEGVLEGYRFLQEEGRPDVVTEFIDIFLADLPGRLDAIRSAVATRDPHAIRSAGHALKGAAGSIGAVRVAALAAELESVGRAGQTSGTDELAESIAVEAELARATLARFRR